MTLQVLTLIFGHPPCKDIEALEEGGNRVLKLFRPNGKLSDFNSLSLEIV